MQLLRLDPGKEHSPERVRRKQVCDPGPKRATGGKEGAALSVVHCLSKKDVTPSAAKLGGMDGSATTTSLCTVSARIPLCARTDKSATCNSNKRRRREREEGGGREEHLMSKTEPPKCTKYPKVPQSTHNNA